MNPFFRYDRNNPAVLSVDSLSTASRPFKTHLHPLCRTSSSVGRIELPVLPGSNRVAIAPSLQYRLDIVDCHTEHGQDRFLRSSSDVWKNDEPLILQKW